MFETFGILAKGLFEYGLARGVERGGLAGAHRRRRHVPDPGMAMLVVNLSRGGQGQTGDANICGAQVTATMLIEPDHVYISPPEFYLAAVGTHLRLSHLKEKAFMHI